MGLLDTVAGNCERHRPEVTAWRTGGLKEGEKIRILRVIARLNIGGPAVHVHLLTGGLDAGIFESTLVTGRISPGEGDMSYLFDACDRKPIVVPELQRELSFRMDLRSLHRVFNLIREIKPDVLDTHTAKAGAVARVAVLIYNLLFRERVRTVHTFHGHVFEGYFSRMKSLLFVWMERFLARFTDAIIAISESQKKALSDRFRIAPAGKIRTLALGFDLEPFLQNRMQRGQFRRSFGISHEALLVGIVGRLVPVKNHAVFLRAAAAFVELNPGLKAHFAIVGDGELRPELEASCRKLGLGDHVTFCGWVRNAPAVYGDLDILVLSSTNEGTPVSIIEAMASCVPIVATDAGGVRDLLGGPAESSMARGFALCERGILCRRGDPLALAKAMTCLVQTDRTEKQDRLARARAFVEKQYSSERLVRDMESLYLDLMRSGV